MKRAPSDYPIEPVALQAVTLCDTFWAPRLETNRAVTIPALWQRCEESERIRHFEHAAARLRGEPRDPATVAWLPFDDSDVYKLIEASAYALRGRPAPELEAQLDPVIAQIAAAQEPDGYLYTTRTSQPEAPHAWSGLERWAQETDVGHELYDLGHLYEAAVAHQQATGKRNLLEIALRTAALLLDTFGPGKRSIWPGHQGIELALVKLYRATGERRYLELAQFFLQQRGPDGKPRSGVEYNQSHLPVAEQTAAVGHAVHATYMYAGIADVAALTDDAAYRRMLERVWRDLVTHKLYVTGGIGASARGESFGPADELENASAFNETCASVGLLLFCQRMFLCHGQAEFIDVLERVLYNSLLAGVSLTGAAFFYDNPLASAGDRARSPWFECACCPGNLARLLAQLPGYFYAQRDSTVYVNLYATNRAELTLPDGRQLTLTQQTEYPWHGVVRLRVTPSAGGPLTLKLRIPGWARAQVVPSDLYRYGDARDEAATVAINGERVSLALEAGYVTLERDWQAGDEIELTLPMPIRRVLADPRVAADRGRVALQRGPLVYACEALAPQAGSLEWLVLPRNAELTARYEPALLGGVVALTSAELDLTAIPYFAWANRGASAMRVWLPYE